MLSIVPLKDPGAVVSYFEKDNYYAKDDPQAKQYSRWFGRGAEKLELGHYDKGIPDENVFYHGTNKKFDTFVKTSDIGFHFGTYEQAESRAERRLYDDPDKEKLRIIKAHIEINNPLRVKDTKWWSPPEFGEVLRDSVEHVINKIYEDYNEFKEEWNPGIDVEKTESKVKDLVQLNSKLDSIYNSDWTHEDYYPRVKDELKKCGFDGLVYQNRVEGDDDRGKDSYVAFDNRQIRQVAEKYISKGVFTEILEGRVGDKRLGREVDGKWEHTPGWDLTFSAPKSYSILNQLTDDQQLRDAHDKAVKAALRYLEDHASYVRITKNGKTQKILQRNLTVAMFRHDTSRALDPNDHTHCVVANAVETDSGWRSLDSKKFFDMKLQAGEFYRRQLARELNKIGYEIEVARERDFLIEIKGVPKDLIEHHSKRRKDILDQLKNLELDSAKAASVAALDTRNRKIDADRNTLKRQWRSVAKQFNFDADSVVAAAKVQKKRLNSHTNKINPSEKTLEVVDHAIAVISEREASFESERLIQECSISPLYSPSYDEIISGINQRIATGDLIRTGDDNLNMFTTEKGQALEKAMIRQLYDNYEKFDPIRGDVDLEKMFPDITFSKGQAESLKLILETNDQFTGVQGYAGTGKTFMLNAAATIAEMSGFEVKGMAPSSAAAQVLQDEIGRESVNLAQHMGNYYRLKKADPKSEIDYSKQLWFVDESSLGSTKDLKNIMDISVKTGARVVFVGDIAQKDSVESGRAFYQLQAAGMDTAIMDDIKRQKDQDLKKAVYSLVSLISVNDLKRIDKEMSRDIVSARKDFKAFCETAKTLVPDGIHKQLVGISDRLDTAQTGKQRTDCLKDAISLMSDDVTKALNNLKGRISEIDGSVEREQGLVDDFMKLSKDERDNTILVVPSNKGRESVNQKLRQCFADEGVLKGNEIEVAALVNRGLESQRLKHSYAYKVDDIIRFGRNFRKDKKVYIKTGEYYRVSGKEDGELQLQKITTEKGEKPSLITWKPQKTMSARSVELYEERQRGVRVGERIRWRKNIAHLDIINSEESTVQKINGSVMTVINAKGVAKNFDLSQISSRHLDYAYTHTVDSAQGATFKRVMGICESWRKNLINQKALYVVISRAQEHARLYTDKAGALFDAIIDRHGANTVAIDAKAYAKSIESYQKNGNRNKIDQEQSHRVLLRADDGQEHSITFSCDKNQAKSKGVEYARHIGLSDGSYRIEVSPVDEKHKQSKRPGKSISDKSYNLWL